MKIRKAMRIARRRALHISISGVLLVATVGKGETVVILHMGKARSRRFFKIFTKNSPRGFLLSPDNSKVYFCPTPSVCPTKTLALQGRMALPSHATPLKLPTLMTTTKKRTRWSTATDPCIYWYNFKLTIEENIQFGLLTQTKKACACPVFRVPPPLCI